MKLSRSSARLLQELMEQKELNGSRFNTNKLLLKQLGDEGIVNIIPLTRTRRRVVLADQNALERYIADEYEVYDIAQLQQLRDNSTTTRSELTQISADSKMLAIKPMEGMHVSSSDGIKILIDGLPVTLQLPVKTTLFIHQSATVSIDEDILVIGIENFENIAYAAAQTTLFGNERKKLFVLRNPAMLKWIGSIANDYIHFGDFDLAGIAIYLYEIVPRLQTKKHTFYIPNDIETLLDKGSRNRYHAQYQKYKNISSDDSKVQELVTLINKKKRVLEQEYLVGHLLRR